jgi:threonine dehydratase
VPVWLKLESQQATGSFKLRGASNAVAQLDAEHKRLGVVTASTGNHGRALAFAASQQGVKAIVCLSELVPQNKVRAIRELGAEVVISGRSQDDAQLEALRIAREQGAAFIPPFDHPHVIAGQGTLALELVEDAKAAGFTMDAMLACTGGGGLIAGCALAVEGASPDTRLYAVEPEGWDDTGRSLASGNRETNIPGGSTLCDALLAHSPGKLTFAVNRPRLAGGLAVTDAEVLAAIKFAFAHLKLVVEPGGAVCLAALLAGKFDAKGKVVGLVLSGGNIDPDVFGRALAA